MHNHEIRKKISGVVHNVARYMEIILSIGVLIIALFSAIELFWTVTQTPFKELDSAFFTSFLAQGLAIIVGLEFVDMLCRHTVESLIEVLLFATARQMVVEHLKNWETLMGVLAIGVLFAIHKYLVVRPDRKEKEKEEKKES